MVFHMKTTLHIDDAVMRRLREEAARRDTTISALVEAALRQFLEAKAPKGRDLPPLPSFESGGSYVDLSDREALYRRMEGR
jgi:hypothetical protein